MIALVLSALLFVGLHFLISSTPLRGGIVALTGERAFLGLFSLLSGALILWMVMAFLRAPRDAALWAIPGIGHLALTLMPLALILLVAGYMTRNPTAVMTAPPGGGWQPGGIFTVTRHPIMWGIGLWAVLHVLANGDGAGLVFFGAFAVLSLAGTLAIDAKKRRTWPAESVRQLFATTSNLPFLAIAQGRARFDWRGLGVPLAITIALYLAIVLWFHPQVIGAPLF
ncbi:MAG TPA: NnrU family protein [Dongiaceae bacterium]|nr:NnrU family protein [Dongiaceae bacterium]